MCLCNNWNSFITKYSNFCRKIVLVLSELKTWCLKLDESVVLDANIDIYTYYLLKDGRTIVYVLCNISNSTTHTHLHTRKGRMPNLSFVSVNWIQIPDTQEVRIYFVNSYNWNWWSNWKCIATLLYLKVLEVVSYTSYFAIIWLTRVYVLAWTNYWYFVHCKCISWPLL